jgi:hypothetical protein
MLMKASEIIQLCELQPFTGQYDLAKFLEITSRLTPDEFDEFCKELLERYHFFASNLNAWATDDETIVKQLPEDTFWLLKPLDDDKQP